MCNSSGGKQSDDGLEVYSDAKANNDLPPGSLINAVENTALWPKSNGIPQGLSGHTGSSHCKANATICSRLIISPNYKQSWLATSTEPLSKFDGMIIRAMIRTRIALQCGGSTLTVLAILLVFGMLTYGGVELPRVGNLPPSLLYAERPCDRSKYHIHCKRRA